MLAVEAVSLTRSPRLFQNRTISGATFVNARPQMRLVIRKDGQERRERNANVRPGRGLV